MSADDRPFGERSITGYCDRWSATPGETLQFMVNCEAETYEATVVKLICGDVNPDGPGYKAEIVDHPVSGTYPGRRQPIHSGSHGIVPDPEDALRRDGELSLCAMVRPTRPATGEQGILTRWSAEAAAGYGLLIDDTGALAFRLGGPDGMATASTEVPIDADRWQFVAASYDAGSETVRLHQARVPAPDHRRPDPDRSSVDVERPLADPGPDHANRPAILAGWCRNDIDSPAGATADTDPIVTAHYDGRIDAPRVVSSAVVPAALRALVDDPSAGSGADHLVAAWDFAAGITSDGIRDPDRIADVGPYGLDGRLRNSPARAVPGYDWLGERYDYTSVPSEYGAIHFHADDLTDAGWDVDIELDVPTGMESAVYALRLRADDEYFVPFYVRPETRDPTADIAFLAPTNTYLAYANNHMKLDGGVGGLGREPVFEEWHFFLSAHREYGLSLYDTHADGSGSMFSTRLRPLISVQPKFVRGGAPSSHLHGFNADLYLIDWLEHHGYAYDVITDEDVYRDGADLLSGYDVVLTGHHPEYHSREEFEAIEHYQDAGGRFMYLGGNGFYWVIAHHPDEPGIIETRRGETGSESWVPEPGEKHHQFTGRKGGLWRERGWPPGALVGVGTCGMWEVLGTHYRRGPDADAEAVSFVWDGIDGDTFGDFGLLGGGAAGQEIDRYDTARGCPEHAYLLASSEGHTEHELRVIEEMPGNEPFMDGRNDPKVRADVIYARTANDGAMFATGSMAWIGALSHDDYDNDVSRITKNVLDRFLVDGPLPGETVTDT